MRTIVRVEIEHPDDVSVFDCMRSIGWPDTRYEVSLDETAEGHTVRYFWLPGCAVVTTDQPEEP